MSLLFNVFLEGLLGESCGSLAVIIFGKGSDNQQRCNQKDGLHREVWLRYETGELPGKRCYFHLEKSSLGLLVKKVTKHFFDKSLSRRTLFTKLTKNVKRPAQQSYWKVDQQNGVKATLSLLF